MYGVVSAKHLSDTVKYVCDILGHGTNGKAMQLLLETAMAETSMGKTKDTTKYAGMGITQFDEVGFNDVLDRVRFEDVAIIKEKMDIELSWVKWEDLRYNPLLCFIFTRLKYKKIPELIPNDVYGRAKYWKDHYNSHHKNAKGTIGHYLEANKKQIMV